jgi:hypothetical protein
LYEELETEDEERTRQVYKACLDIIPHKKFTFAKIWLLFAQFELRQKNLQNARKVMVSLDINNMSPLVQEQLNSLYNLIGALYNLIGANPLLH